MVRFAGKSDIPEDDYRRPVISRLWLADKAREEQDAVFDDTIKAFLERDDELVEVEYEPVTEGIACLLASIMRLGLDSDIAVYVDEHERIILEKMT